LRWELDSQHDSQPQFSQSIYHNEFEMNENKPNKINIEDNIDLMDEYNNENMLDNNSENEIINENKINEDIINKDIINKNKINEDKINDDKINEDKINENQKLAEKQEEILKNSNIEDNIKISSNENHAKTLHDNSKSNENNTIINRNNDNNIKGIKITKNDFF